MDTTIKVKKVLLDKYFMRIVDFKKFMKEARGCASRIKLIEKMNLKKIIIRENINDDT